MTIVGIACVRQSSGDQVAVVDSSVVFSEMKTSSGASQATTGAALDDFSFWEITTKDGAVWVTFGTNPTAVAGTTFLVPAGATRHYNARLGHKAAVIDA